MEGAAGDREPVVVATDGSQGAEAAVAAGARVARTLGTTAVLVYVRPSLGPLGDPYYQEKLSEQMAHARAAIERASELLAQEGVDAEEEILEGSVSSAIIHRADRPVLVVPRPDGTNESR
jgi:nucleotide-binding universal stress UspA family protein